MSAVTAGGDAARRSHAPSNGKNTGAVALRLPNPRYLGPMRIFSGSIAVRPSGRRGVSSAAGVVVGLIALLRLYILVLETFLWDKPAGLGAFGQTQTATACKVLAAKQEFDNGYLAAGWLWGLSPGAEDRSVRVFSCAAY
ncbi:MAG TPA: DUF1304 domain-containing protein [Burkholderiaceae bacterium]|nr:DUF1304 domain-containing protein [Burkholderiaceae bacterium]